MNNVTRYSTGATVPSTSVSEAVVVIELTWMNEFWPPAMIQGDPAFNLNGFKVYVERIDIRFRQMPPKSNNKIAIESKHRDIRDLFLRLQTANLNLAILVDTTDPHTP